MCRMAELFGAFGYMICNMKLAPGLRISAIRLEVFFF
jgi:hypothetical protein